MQSHSWATDFIVHASVHDGCDRCCAFQLRSGVGNGELFGWIWKEFAEDFPPSGILIQRREFHLAGVQRLLNTARTIARRRESLTPHETWDYQ